MSGLIFSGSLMSIAQPPDSLWMKTYGGIDNEIGFAVMEPENGIYILAGKTESYGNGGSDLYIVKLDNNGGPVWERYYGGMLNEAALGVCEALYGGYMLTGSSGSYASGLSDLWVLWVGGNGDSLNARSWGGPTSDQGYSIFRTVDQDYIITGFSSVYLWGDQLYLLRMDVNMDTVWTKRYGSPYQDYGRAVLQTTDGGFIIGGYSYLDYTSDAQFWLLKTDGNGDTLWSRKYGGPGNEMAYTMAALSDGYAIAGQTDSYGAGLSDLWLVRTDMNGDTLWTRTFGGTGADLCYGLETDETGFYLAGYTNSFGWDNYQIYLVKAGPDGSLLWQDTYGSDENELTYGFCRTTDGGFLITGKYDEIMTLNDDAFVLKLGPETAGTDEKVESGAFSPVLFPDPATDHITVLLPGPPGHGTAVEILNVRGQKVFGQTFTSGNNIRIHLGQFPAGIYLCRVSREKQSNTQRFIKR
ncbi:MAG: T9SS type A sorting domain-containing protein [Bacteroidales bacterium]|nr:T9SS type A sorting domain-containing protein [Bacteroidales bacterium]